MRALYALLLATVAAGVFLAAPAWSGDIYGERHEVRTVGTMVYDPGYNGDWLIPAAWRHDRDRYYDRFERRRDHRRFYGNHHFYGDRHYRGKHYYGKRHYRPYYRPRPYGFSGRGYYRSYGGGNLYFSGCFRSGGVTLCFNR